MSKIEIRTPKDLKRYLAEGTQTEPSDKIVEELYVRLGHTAPEQMKAIYSLGISAVRSSVKKPFDDCFVYAKESGDASWDDVSPIMECFENEGLKLCHFHVSPNKKLVIGINDKYPREKIKERVDGILLRHGYRSVNNKQSNLSSL